MGKQLPAPRCRLFDRVLAAPELHQVVTGVRRGPVDAYGVQVLLAGQIENDPLRMRRVVLAGETLREIGIALPERPRVTIRQARIADRIRTVIAGDAAARQRISVGVDDGLRPGLRSADEVAALPRLAPGAVRVPVPG